MGRGGVNWDHTYVVTPRVNLSKVSFYRTVMKETIKQFYLRMSTISIPVSRKYVVSSKYGDLHKCRSPTSLNVWKYGDFFVNNGSP